MTTIIETDAAVRMLHRHQVALCVEVYVVGGRVATVAARMGVSAPSLYRKIDELHQALKSFLTGNRYLLTG